MNYCTALIQLPLVRENSSKTLVRTPADTARVCSDIADLAVEAFHVITLNGRNRIINRHMVSLGLVDATLVHPREVFICAITDHASAVIVAHNHPSGDPVPSAEDIRITRQLIQAGQIIGIKVLDHVVIGRATDTTPGHYSMRESGICSFTDS